MKQRQTKKLESFHSSIVIRVSERDRGLILAGLNWIVGNYKLSASGQQLMSPLAMTWARGRFDPGVFNQELMNSMIALHATLLSLGSGGRLRVKTSYEIAACALAVRVYLKRRHRGRTDVVIPLINGASKRLLRRLEAARKRGWRAEVRQLGLSVYQARAHNWRRFIRWIRVHIPDCGPARTRPPARRGYLRLIVDKLVSWARAELLDRKEKLPDDHELRRLIRLKIRYVRRGRTGYGIRHLLDDKVFASAQLATFITIHMEKLPIGGHHEGQQR